MSLIELLESRQYMSAAVTGWTLADSSTDKTIGTLINGAVIDLAKTPHFAIGTTANGDTDRIVYKVDNGPPRTETASPWFVASNDGRDIYELKLTAGEHVITATPQEQVRGRWVSGKTATLKVTVVNGTTPTPEPDPDPTPQPSPGGPPIAGDWSLTFADEFSGSSVSSKWTPQYWWFAGDTGDNGELQRYTADSSTVKDGILSITASKSSGKAKFDGKTYAYKSGLLTTGGSENGQPVGFNFTYGYAEARIKIPAGQGLWSAFWMLPTSHKDGNGEIDVMEVLGQTPDSLETHYHVHGKDTGHASDVVDLSKDFHTYGLDWEADKITWYLDGKAVFSAANQTREPMYLLLNLAVGGDWPGAPNASTKFPSSMLVDYVRVYQQK